MRRSRGQLETASMKSAKLGVRGRDVRHFQERLHDRHTDRQYHKDGKFLDPKLYYSLDRK